MEFRTTEVKKTRDRVILLIIFIFIATLFQYPDNIIPLKNLFKTPFPRVEKDIIVIWDQSLRKISLYENQNFKKIAEFGRRGQGPGEFIAIEGVTVMEDYIYVSSFPKICIFSKSGKLVKEIRNTVNAGAFQPIGSKFIGTSYKDSKPNEKQSELIFSLFDSDLDKIKDFLNLKVDNHMIYKDLNKKPTVMIYTNCSSYKVYKDKLYIASTDKGFYIAVYNSDGKFQYEIQKEFSKRKITEDDKKTELDNLRKELGENEWARRKLMSSYDFPEYYPAFNNFTVNDDKIYVFQYPLGGKIEVLILDLKGNFIRKKVIPDNFRPGDIFFGRFEVANDKLYFIKENVDSEEWELHVEDF